MDPEGQINLTRWMSPEYPDNVKVWIGAIWLFAWIVIIEHHNSKIWRLFYFISLDDIMLAIKSELMNDWLLMVKKIFQMNKIKTYEMLTDIAVIMQTWCIFWSFQMWSTVCL